jgi:Permease for cytosine/purines, uracil, thiamine, allantoin
LLKKALTYCLQSSKANLISSSVALALGRPGAKYHIGYPVLARSVFGMYGQLFFVWVRAVVAIIWYSFHLWREIYANEKDRFGVQSYFGSQLLGVLLRCIFGNSWWHMANHLPESAGISSRDLLAFFLFWMIEMPFLTVHPSKIKFLFAVSRFTKAKPISSQADNMSSRLSLSSVHLPALASSLGVFTMVVAFELRHSHPQHQPAPEVLVGQ